MTRDRSPAADGVTLRRQSVIFGPLPLSQRNGKARYSKGEKTGAVRARVRFRYRGTEYIPYLRKDGRSALIPVRADLYAGANRFSSITCNLGTSRQLDSNTTIQNTVTTYGRILSVGRV